MRGGPAKPGRAPLRFDPIAEARRQWEVHGWGDAASGMAAVTSVIRAQRIFMDRVEAVLRPLDLSFARYELLMVLLFSRQGSLPLGKLGSRLQVHPTSVTNAVDRLERQGLIERVPHPSDGRTTLATITASGRRVAVEATDALNVGVFADVGLADQPTETLNEVLAVLRRGAGDFEV